MFCCVIEYEAMSSLKANALFSGSSPWQSEGLGTCVQDTFGTSRWFFERAVYKDWLRGIRGEKNRLKGGG
jgi:hypothetical protein